MINSAIAEGRSAMKSRMGTSFSRPLLELLESRCLLSAAAPTVVFQDSFNGADGASVNSSLWHIPTFVSSKDGTFVPRTQFRVTQHASPPTVNAGAVFLPVDSYNPTGSSFYGTEMRSNRTFKIKTARKDGLILNITAKLDQPIQGGVVGGMFLYGLKPDNVNHDEVDDVELVSNWLVAGSNLAQSNVYSDEPVGAGAPQTSALPNGGTLDGYHKYKVVCTSQAIKWYIDGLLVRTDTTIIPTGTMEVRLNAWVPDSSWTAAYNGGIVPTSNTNDNQEFGVSVDKVVVKRIQPAPPQQPQGQPAIHISSVPTYGAYGSAAGTITGLSAGDYSQYDVATFIEVNGGWWTKPTFAQPTVPINSDGSWRTNITTGGNDQNATAISVFLVPGALDVPSASGQANLPQSLLIYPSDTVCRSPL